MRQRVIALLLALSVVVVFLPESVGMRIKAAGVRALAPVTGPVSSTYQRIRSFLGALVRLPEVIQGAQDLGERNLRLEAEVAELQEVKVENEILRRELNARASDTSKKFIAASVVGRSPVGLFPELTIDRGSRDGVAKHQPVLVAGHLAGLITEVAPVTATVRLITAHNSVVPVVLQSSRAVGLLRGGLRGLAVDDLPADAQIAPGELVVTEKIGDLEFPGIAVGRIEKIVSPVSEIFQVASVTSPIDFSKITLVSVVSK